MGTNPRKILQTADKGVKTTESWWALAKALWEEGKWLLPLAAAGAGVIGAALVSAFEFISSFGWAGWVFAIIAGFVVVCLLALIGLSVVWLLRVVRRTKETAQSTEPVGDNQPEENENDEAIYSV